MDSRKSKPLLYDQLMLKRVKQYLEENVDKTYVDIPEMTKHLQAQYPEYARRKQQPLRELVEQAYRIVSDQFMEGPQTSGEDSELSDLEVMADSSSNIMNNMMNSLYNKPRPNLTVRPVTTPAVQIDISSDEESDKDAAPASVVKSNVGTATTSGSGEKANGAQKSKKATDDFLESASDDDDFSKSSGAGGATDVASNSATSSSTSSGAGGAQSNVDGAAKRHGQDSPSLSQANKKRKEDMQNQGRPRLFGPTFSALNAAANAGGNGSINAANFTLDKDRYTFNNVEIRRTTGNAGNHQGNMGQQRRGISPVMPQQQQHPHQQQAHHMHAQNHNMHPPLPTLTPLPKLRKYKKELHLVKSNDTFRDIGGMESALMQLCEILMHLKTPGAYLHLGLMPPRGILLHGPTGCGKTLLARAIAGQLDLPMCEVPATELIAGVSGESEQRIRDIFEQAVAFGPCILFIDEIDAIASSRSMAQRDMERRIVSQLISSLDEIRRSSNGLSILVIGATTRPDVVDPSLRRIGRFDHEIAISVPNRRERKQILDVLCDGVGIDPKCDFDKVAEITPGFVGADLLALISRAATVAVKRKYSQQLHLFQMNALTIVDLDADDTVATDLDDTVNNKNNGNEDNQDKSEQMDVDESTTKNQENATKTTDATDKAEKPKNDKETEEEKEENAEGKNSPTEAEATARDAAGAEENAKTTAAAIVAVPTQSTTAATPATNKPKETEKEPDSKEIPKNNVVSTTSKLADDNMDADDSSEHDEGKEFTIDPNLKVRQPTLSEMLNWLDNPPDDPENMHGFYITFEDIVEAIKLVQPSAKREGFITVPDTTWDDIGSLQDIREELKLAVLAPVKYPEMLQRLGMNAPSGVLLCGPPGCGKTLLAKAIANEAGINFISVKGPEMMNMYVGESERAVRACFQRARNSAPCVIFFDEFDSLCPKRSEGNDSGSGTRIVNQLLTEMDGIEERKGVYILAATNRPDIIDPAILRPGRLDTILYVGLPQEKDRVEILKATTKNATRPVLDKDVDFEELAKQTDGYTGADLAGLVKQASMLALKEALNNPEIKTADLCVSKKHFDEAFKLLRPSISDQDRKTYEKLRLKYAAQRSATI